MTTSSDTRRRIARFVPSALGSRLVVAILLANLVVVGCTVIVLLLMSSLRFSTSEQVAFLVIVLAVAAVTSAVTGFALARTIGRPMTELSAYMQAGAADALDGRTTDPIPRDPLLPTEYSDLLDVFERILHRLAVRNAELTETTLQAEADRWSLQVAFSESLEGKLLARDGLIVLLNPAAASMFAIGPTEAIGKPPHAVFARSSARSEEGRLLTFDEVVEMSRSRAIRVHYEVRGRTARWLEVRSVVHQGAGTTLLTMRDITDERRVERVRDDIISLVSHDLRAPLSVISGYLDLLGQDLPAEARAKALAASRQATMRMDDLLSDLLSATRAEQLLSPNEFAPVSLSELVAETASSFEHTSSHLIRVDTHGQGLVLGDEKRLRQALVNLLTNAMKFSEKDTAIRLAVREESGLVVASVEDEGPGIPHEHREAVFERYARLSEDDVSQPGFGLGLYIVKAIVQSHGGSVRVEQPESGRGAHFIMTLPAAPI